MCVCVCLCLCLCLCLAGGGKESVSVFACVSLRTSEGCGTLGDIKGTYIYIYIYKVGLWLVCVNNPRRLAVFPSGSGSWSGTQKNRALPFQLKFLIPVKHLKLLSVLF